MLYHSMLITTIDVLGLANPLECGNNGPFPAQKRISQEHSL